MSETYRVIMTGKLADGYTVEQVRSAVSQLFKLNESQLDKLFSGKPVVVRRGLSRAQAVKLQTALMKVGALVSLQQEQAADTGQQPSADPAPSAAASAAVGQPDERLTCPRCGHEQPLSQACSLCKMDLTLHLQRLKRKAAARAFRRQQQAGA